MASSSWACGTKTGNSAVVNIRFIFYVLRHCLRVSGGGRLVRSPPTTEE